MGLQPAGCVAVVVVVVSNQGDALAQLSFSLRIIAAFFLSLTLRQHAIHTRTTYLVSLRLRACVTLFFCFTDPPAEQACAPARGCPHNQSTAAVLYARSDDSPPAAAHLVALSRCWPVPPSPFIVSGLLWQSLASIMPGKFKSKHKKQGDKADNGGASSPSTSSSQSANGQSASNGAMSSIEQLKDKGNQAFTTGNFQRALELYTQAIDEAAAATTAASASSSSSTSASSTAIPTSLAHPPFPTHTLYSNRSATQLALKNYAAALSDADAAIILAPQWPKGYLRKGNALEQLLRYHDAHAAYQQGMKLDGSDAALNKCNEELSVLLDELKISENELTQHAANPDSDRFTTMCNWLRSGGAQFPKLYLQYYSEDYRGVHALARVPPDDIILYVPFSLIMTSQVAMESEIGKQIIAAKVELRSKHSYLASYLLQEKEKATDSYWYPYLACLPAYYNNMPIFFPPSLLAMLKGSFTLQKIQDRIDSLRTEYDNIKAVVPTFARFSHDDFVWARLVVITRIFGLVINGVKTDGLVPYADMLNHKKPRVR